MIIWSGRGFLSVLVLIVSLFACIYTLPKEFADYGFIISFFMAGTFSWFFGKKWNTQNERIFIDEKTGQRVKIKNNHNLFWIPMQYWGIIFSVIALVILFQSLVIFGVIASLILIALMALPYVKQWSPTEMKTNKNSSLKTKKEEVVANEIEKEFIDEAELIRLRSEKENPNRFMPK